MTAEPLLYQNTFHLDGSGDWLPFLKEMLSGARPGILSTVDHEDQPQMRWMSTLSLGFYPYLYALTSSGSQKVREIRAHPEVTWMFFNQDLTFITTLRGKARVLVDLPAFRSVARQMPEQMRSTFVDRYLVGHQAVVLETTIESVECASPANSFKYVARADELEIGCERLESFEDRSVLNPAGTEAA